VQPADGGDGGANAAEEGDQRDTFLGRCLGTVVDDRAGGLHLKRQPGGERFKIGSGLATQVIGKRKSLVHHRATCANAARMTATNRVTFASEKEAAAAGYRPGKDCFK
jgi:hypothetical protein